MTQQAIPGEVFAKSFSAISVPEHKYGHVQKSGCLSPTANVREQLGSAANRPLVDIESCIHSVLVGLPQMYGWGAGGWERICMGGRQSHRTPTPAIYLRLVQLLHAVTVHVVNRPSWVALLLPGLESLICQFCHLGSFLLAGLPCCCCLVVLSTHTRAQQHCADSNS